MLSYCGESPTETHNVRTKQFTNDFALIAKIVLIKIISNNIF